MIRGEEGIILKPLSSLGITDEQVIQNLAPCLSAKINETDKLNWPPRIDELENKEIICDLLLKLSCLLKKPKKVHKSIYDPTVHSLTSLITYFVTGKRTAIVVNMAVLVHRNDKKQGIDKNVTQEWAMHKL